MKTLIKLSLTFAFLHCILAGCANAQTIDLSTDEAVVEQFGKQKNEKLAKDDVCIKRSAKVIVIGFMGCSFHAAFVNSVYLEESADLSKNALNALGWKEANQKGREELAKLWVENGLLAFSSVLYAKDKELSNDEFHPPQVVSRENGEVVVTLWVSFERMKLGRKVSGLTKGFRQYEYKFAKDGNSTERVTHETLVPKPVPVHKRCIKKELTESAAVKINASFSAEYGCYFAGVFVNSDYIKKDDAALSKIVLAAIGWEKANQTERTKLAKLWVEKGVLAFSHVLYTRDKGMKNLKFQPPQVVSKTNGAITVTLWIRLPAGMMREKERFQRLKFNFTKEGNLLAPMPLEQFAP